MEWHTRWTEDKIKKAGFDVKASVGSLLDNVGKALKPGGGSSGGNDHNASLPERMQAALTRFGGRVLVVLSGADLTAQECAGLSNRPGAWQRLLEAPCVT